MHPNESHGADQRQGARAQAALAAHLLVPQPLTDVDKRVDELCEAREFKAEAASTRDPAHRAWALRQADEARQRAQAFGLRSTARQALGRRLRLRRPAARPAAHRPSVRAAPRAGPDSDDGEPEPPPRRRGLDDVDVDGCWRTLALDLEGRRAT